MRSDQLPKILVCHNSYKNTSGEDLVIATDIQILKENDISIREYARSNKETDTFSLSNRISFFPNTVYSSRSAKEVREVCQEFHPDVAFVQNVFPLISPSVYYALHECGVPIIQLVYNYRLICPNAILFTEGKICERCVSGNFSHAIIHKCYRNSRPLSALYATTLAVHRYVGDLRRLITAYITPDQFLQQKLAQGGYPRERMFAMLNPFDVTKYIPQYGHEGYFVYFGRIVREKGIFTLLKAMSNLPDMKLIVVGGGEAEEEARGVAAKDSASSVSFTGPMYGDELVKILRGAIAVIVPTEWYDNSPLVVHQAFAIGKPVIASDIDGIPEIVEHGKNGLLFQPGSSVELAEKMRQLVGNEPMRMSLARNARSKAEIEFTSKRRFDGLMGVINYAQENIINS